MNDKKLHLEHAEDNVIFGMDAIRETLDLLKLVNESYQGKKPENLVIQYKVDGSPNLVFGTNPENGRFFVGTKSVFSKNPKICYHFEDVDKYYGFSSYDSLRKILKMALLHLPDLNVKGVMSGDVMFIEDLLEPKVINDLHYVTFKPNIIRYAYDDRGLKFGGVKIGLFIHTQYEGTTLENMSAKYVQNLNHLTPVSWVWFRDTNFHNWFTPKEYDPYQFNEQWKYCRYLYENYRKALHIRQMDGLPEEFISYIQMFVNDQIKAGNIIAHGNIVDELMEFIQRKMAFEASKLKTRYGQEKHMEKFQKLKDISDNRKMVLQFAFELMDEISYLKSFLLDKLPYTLRPFNLYFDNPNGTFIPCKPEGLVAMNLETGFSFKLVDRSTFSRRNFIAHQ